MNIQVLKLSLTSTAPLSAPIWNMCQLYGLHI